MKRTTFPRRRPDGVTAIMVVVTAAALLGAVWLKTRGRRDEPPPWVRLLPRCGYSTWRHRNRSCSSACAARWYGLSSGRPIPFGEIHLAAIERPGPLRARGQFAMVPAASRPIIPIVSVGGRPKPREDAGLSRQCRDPARCWRGRPTSARADRCRGRIAAIAREASQQTIDRIANQVKAARRTGAKG